MLTWCQHGTYHVGELSVPARSSIVCVTTPLHNTNTRGFQSCVLVTSFPGASSLCVSLRYKSKTLIVHWQQVPQSTR